MNLEDYKAARENVAYFIIPHPGYLRLSGPDRANFIQRQTTNDIRLLNEESVLLSVLTSPTARILDVLFLLAEPEAIGCITQSGRDTATARFLGSRIFFMDKVSITNASHDYTQIDLEGPSAGETLASLGMPRPDGLYKICQAQVSGQTLRLFSKPGVAGLGYRLLVPSIATEIVQEALADSGASLLSPESYQILRVEAGLPGEEHEFIESFTPLEVNLIETIAGDKGCYTGQEIIARQINYDKITRGLLGLRLTALVPPGTPLVADGKPAGVVTSAVESPRLGPIALAVIKRPFNQPGGTIKAQLDQGLVEGLVCELPF